MHLNRKQRRESETGDTPLDVARTKLPLPSHQATEKRHGSVRDHLDDVPPAVVLVRFDPLTNELML